jgi:hypothetical protein
MNITFENPVTLVTGAASGLGLATHMLGCRPRLACPSPWAECSTSDRVV